MLVGRLGGGKATKYIIHVPSLCNYEMHLVHFYLCHRMIDMQYLSLTL